MNAENITLISEHKESIKLMKMSKSYQWEIKLLGESVNEETIKKLKELDGKLRELYGGEE